MAQFININILDLDRFPEADALMVEHGAVFVEIDDGDASLPKSLDWSRLYTASELVKLADDENLHISATCLNDNDDEAFQVLAAACWARKSGYFSQEVTFVHEEE